MIPIVLGKVAYMYVSKNVQRKVGVHYFNQFPKQLLKVAGDRIFISMHLCKEYARSATTHTDNKRNIYEKVP